ncbi:putative transcription factor bHLH family [Medicago truncatula]|uniref:Basic helix loop helix (BHLH) DNA-binding family protein n=2 Tax=Medicago truncatula TaxID=3880 RepID=G7JGD5_MEDTR|nr:transcription factor bHLH19 [Medicago truncatula]AES90788.1 basic helix loop helix (bHLH) DNA-binding family protein [Medicago truncatula]RHN63092.1 putative transcription factor bHLH family [Medicago truncatula]
MIQISSTNYMPEFGLMEDTTLFSDHEYQMDSYAFQFDDMAYFKSFSESPQESTYSSHTNINNKRIHSESTQNSSFPTQSPDQSVASATPPTKLLKASPKIISFDYSNNDSKVKKPKTEIGYGENLNFGSVISQGDYYKRENKVSAVNRNPIQAQDHVMAERRRREKLSQRFISLSSLLPGLKKMDKATILEDAIKHLKQLNERVKTLEEHVADKKVESAVFMKRSILFEEDDRSSCDENSDQSLSKIEARVSGKDMLIRIHGDKHCGRTATAILNELEKHHLSVQSSSILPFGNNYLDITIVAQMNKEYCLTMKDLIRSISQVLRQLI